jgi:hypothetical protein
MKGIKRTKQERVSLVIGLIKKLKYFPRSDFFTNENVKDIYVNLFNEEYPAIKQLKSVFDEYIKNEYSMSGKIKFEEINRKIEYILPINVDRDPVFILKQIQN